MKHIQKTMFAAVIISIIWASAPRKASGRVLPKTAGLVPPETVLLVDIDNFSQFKGQFEKTNLYKLYKDPAMAAFVDDLRAKWREKITKELDNEIAKVIVDADVLPQGKVAIALVLNKQAVDANEPIALSVTQWGENISKIKEAVDKMVKKAIEDGAHRKDEDYRGTGITTIIDQSGSRFSHCFIDDCLMGSVNLEVLKFAIAQTAGASSPTLADDADYTATIAALGPYHDIDFYVNIKQIIKTIITEDPTSKARTTMANLGLDNVTSFGCSIGLSKGPGSSCRGKAFLKIEGSKKGICKMLDIESAALRTPRFIPASVYSVTLCNLNIEKAYNELYNILYRYSPQYAAMMHIPLLPPSPDGQPELELKSGIIDHLGSQIIAAQNVHKPSSESSMSAESLVALAVNNRKALEKSMSLLYSMTLAANNAGASRELLGHTIYLIDFSALLPAFSPGKITPMQEPYHPAVPGFPFCDLLQNGVPGEFFWRMMKEGSKSTSSAVSVGPASAKLGPQGIGELVNASLLPEFDAVRKYFGSSTFYGISRPDGFFFEFNYLNPPATD